MYDNLGVLRAIFSQLGRFVPSNVMVQCHSCQCGIVFTMPPGGEMVHIINCPNCNTPGILFGANFLPVSEEIMSSNDSERKRKHIIGILMKQLHQELEPLVTAIVGVETELCQECGQPKPRDDQQQTHPTEAKQASSRAQTPKQTKPQPIKYTKEQATAIVDRYIELGRQIKDDPENSTLQKQFARQQALYEQVKDLL